MPINQLKIYRLDDPNQIMWCLYKNKYKKHLSCDRRCFLCFSKHQISNKDFLIILYDKLSFNNLNVKWMSKWLLLNYGICQKYSFNNFNVTWMSKWRLLNYGTSLFFIDEIFTLKCQWHYREKRYERNIKKFILF